MKIIVALGNPTTQYARTRHNVGWLVADELARRHALTWRREGSGAAASELAELRLLGGGVAGEKVLLVKPQTYMNSSGGAVAPLMQFYKLPPEALLVLQDDLDSPFGLLKVRFGGRHGGQNGLRDIIRVLGSEAFARVKIGISRPPESYSVSDWVLSKWAAEETATLEELVNLGAGAAETWVIHGLKEAQARFNGTDLRPKPPGPKPSEPETVGNEATPENTQTLTN